MEATKLQQALDEILKKCKDAGHKLHVFKKEDIELESVVGRGEEGIVQLCRIKYYGLEEPAAMKTITSSGGKEMLEFLLKELEMVVLGDDFVSNTVLKVYGVTLIPVNSNTRSQSIAHCHLGIIMERGICNLLELCLREQLSLAMRIRVMTQLARAIHYLHSSEPHILHRDIKPQNFVVIEAEISERTGVLRNVKLKVIDLGMAVVVKSKEEKITGVVGTWGFHAPEMWDEKPYDAKADIFSLAVTFLILLMETPTTSKVDEILDKLHSLKTKGTLGETLMEEVKEYMTKETIPPELEGLLKKMLSCEKKRPSNIGTIYKQLCGIVDKQRRPSSTSQSGFASPIMTRKHDSGRESDSDYSSLHSNSSRGSARDDASSETNFSGSMSPCHMPFPHMSPLSPPLFIHPSSSNSTMHPLSIALPSPTPLSPTPASPPSPSTPSPLSPAPTTPVPGYVTVEEFNSLAEKLKEQSVTLSFKEQLLRQKEAMLKEQKKTVQRMETNNRKLLKKLSLSKDETLKYGVKRPLFRQPLFRQPSAPSVRKRTRSSSEDEPSSEFGVDCLPLATRKRRKTSEDIAGKDRAPSTSDSQKSEVSAVERSASLEPREKRKSRSRSGESHSRAEEEEKSAATPMRAKRGSEKRQTDESLVTKDESSTNRCSMKVDASTTAHTRMETGSSPERQERAGSSDKRRLTRACDGADNNVEETARKKSDVSSSSPPPPPPPPRERPKKGLEEKKCDERSSRWLTHRGAPSPPTSGESHRKISAERLSRMKIKLREAEQRDHEKLATRNLAAASDGLPFSPSSIRSCCSSTSVIHSASPSTLNVKDNRGEEPVLTHSAVSTATTSRVGGVKVDPDDGVELDSTLRITTRNHKTFWQEKVTRSRLHENESLKGVWNGFQGLKRLTSFSKWFGK